MQRLIICLDGTWNTQDDSTNVLHHSVMALQGEIVDADGKRCFQKVHYHKGVGTGALDSITGGAFGFGLELNVREAYHWLVANYHDADEDGRADEVYVFGFSRGAYTARSLVGFISMCGLLRHGAPMSVDELWENYCILGRDREHRTSIWDKVFGQAEPAFRRITDLTVDPWRAKFYEDSRAKDGGSPPDGVQRLPGQFASASNLAEQLLVRCSRRVQITYLGVYDTVGALGLDALAIPGVRSKLAMHHNMRATTIVRHCRHALAVDEHRSSFDFTPLLEYQEHGFAEDDQQGAMLQNQEAQEAGTSLTPEQKAAQYWRRRHAMWRDRIEQRWFVGAHSNIGGGYPTNQLAQYAFRWVLDGATKARMQSEGFTFVRPAPVPPPRDSYAEFAGPLWAKIVRAKRWYRRIQRAPELRASWQLKKAPDAAAGFSLLTINEQVDETVLEAYRNNPDYQPPNVADFVRRKAHDETLSAAERATWQTLSAKTPVHPWLGAAWQPHMELTLWAAFAAAGLLVVAQLFHAALPARGWAVAAVAAMAAGAFAVIDWGESIVNFQLALGPKPGQPRNPLAQAGLDTLYWLRTIGFVLAVFGVLGGGADLWLTGWRAPTLSMAWLRACALWPRIAWLPFAAGVGVLLTNLLDHAPTKRQKSGAFGVFLGILGGVSLIPLVVCAGRFGAAWLAPLFGHPHPLASAPAANAQLAGALLLLQLAAIYLANAFAWVAQPMRGANLGQMVAAQFRGSAQTVTDQLETWRNALASRWDPADENKVAGPAAQAMNHILRQTLWRNMLGCIPLYLCVFMYGLHCAGHVPGGGRLCARIFRVPLWCWLPLLTAAADYTESFFQLNYVRGREEDKPLPPWLPRVCFAVTLAKFAGIIGASLVIIYAIVRESYRVERFGPEAGWRGTLALGISGAAILLLLAVVGGAIYSKWFRPQEEPADSSTDSSGIAQPVRR